MSLIPEEYFDTQKGKTKYGQLRNIPLNDLDLLKLFIPSFFNDNECFSIVGFDCHVVFVFVVVDVVIGVAVNLDVTEFFNGLFNNHQGKK